MRSVGQSGFMTSRLKYLKKKAVEKANQDGRESRRKNNKIQRKA